MIDGRGSPALIAVRWEGATDISAMSWTMTGWEEVPEDAGQ